MDKIYVVKNDEDIVYVSRSKGDAKDFISCNMKEGEDEILDEWGKDDDTSGKARAEAALQYGYESGSYNIHPINEEDLNEDDYVEIDGEEISCDEILSKLRESDDPEDEE